MKRKELTVVGGKTSTKKFEKEELTGKSKTLKVLGVLKVNSEMNAVTIRFSTDLLFLS